MGALFELLAELVVALTLASLAQFGISLDRADDHDGQRPAIERTVLRTLPEPSVAVVAEEDCVEARGLQSA